MERVVSLVIPALSTHPLWSWAASLAASFLEPNVAVSPNQTFGMGFGMAVGLKLVFSPLLLIERNIGSRALEGLQQPITKDL